MRQIGYVPKGELNKLVYSTFFSNKPPALKPGNITDFGDALGLYDIDVLITDNPDLFEAGADLDANRKTVVDTILEHQEEYCMFEPSPGDFDEKTGEIDGVVPSSKCRGMYVSKAFREIDADELVAWLESNNDAAKSRHASKDMDDRSDQEEAAAAQAAFEAEQSEKKPGNGKKPGDKDREAGEAQAAAEQDGTDAGQDSSSDDGQENPSEGSSGGEEKQPRRFDPEEMVGAGLSREFASRSNAMSMLMSHMDSQNMSYAALNDAARYLKNVKWSPSSRLLAMKLERVNRSHIELNGKLHAEFDAMAAREHDRIGKGKLPKKEQSRAGGGVLGSIRDKFWRVNSETSTDTEKQPTMFEFGKNGVVRFFSSARSFLSDTGGKLKSNGTVIGLVTGTALFAAAHPLSFLKNTARGIKNAINDAVERNRQPGNEKTREANNQMYEAAVGTQFDGKQNPKALLCVLRQAAAIAYVQGDMETFQSIDRIAARMSEEQAEVTVPKQDEKQAEVTVPKQDEKQAEATASRQGEEQQDSAEASRQGEEQEDSAEASRQGEEQEDSAEASRQGEEQEDSTEASQQGEEQEDSTEASQQGEEQEDSTEASQQGEEQEEDQEALSGGEQAGFDGSEAIDPDGFMRQVFDVDYDNIWEGPADEDEDEEERDEQASGQPKDGDGKAGEPAESKDPEQEAHERRAEEGRSYNRLMTRIGGGSEENPDYEHLSGDSWLPGQE